MSGISWDDVGAGLQGFSGGLTSGMRARYLDEETEKVRATNEETKRKRDVERGQSAVFQETLTGQRALPEPGQPPAEPSFIQQSWDYLVGRQNAAAQAGDGALPSNTPEAMMAKRQEMRRTMMPPDGSLTPDQYQTTINAMNGAPPTSELSQAKVEAAIKQLLAAPGANPKDTMEKFVGPLLQTYAAEVGMGMNQLALQMENGNSGYVSQNLPKLWSRVFDGTKLEMEQRPGQLWAKQIDEKTGKVLDTFQVTSDRLLKVGSSATNHEAHRNYLMKIEEHRSKLAKEGAETEKVKQEVELKPKDLASQIQLRGAQTGEARARTGYLNEQTAALEAERLGNQRKTTPASEQAFGAKTGEWATIDPALSNHIKTNKLDPQRAAGLQSSVSEFAQGVWKSNRGLSDAKAREVGRDMALGKAAVTIDGEGVSVEHSGQTYRLPPAFARYYKGGAAPPPAGGEGPKPAPDTAAALTSQPAAINPAPVAPLGQGTQPAATAVPYRSPAERGAVGLALDVRSQRGKVVDDVEKELRAKVAAKPDLVPKGRRSDPEGWIRTEAGRVARERLGAVPASER